MAKTSAEERIRSYFTSFFISEPILFAVVNTHKLVANDQIKSFRIGNKMMEYNPKFIDSLDEKALKTLLIFETFRILLKHPYERARQNPIANFTGSNVTVQEHLTTSLEMPHAKDLFQNLLRKNRSKDQEKFLEAYEDLRELDEAELKRITGMSKTKLEAIKNSIPDYDEEDLNKRFFEFYYNLVDQNLPELVKTAPHFKTIKDKVDEAMKQGDQSGGGSGEQQEGDEEEEGQPQKGDGEGNEEQKQDGEGTEPAKDLKEHFDPANAWEEQANWGSDDLMANEINDVIQKAQATNDWGSVPGKMRDQLIASLKPKLDYRSILRKFRATMITSETTINRMRPNRRYGFGFPGKKREFTTKLAFFVDVSGSMSDDTLRKGFSIINRFFKYGIQSTDVYQFDTEIKDEKPVTMHQARKEFKLIGRGGTDFSAVLKLLHKKGNPYDGVIIYTDGYAARPNIPNGLNTDKILFLFDTEQNYNACKKNLEGVGKQAFVKSDREG